MAFTSVKLKPESGANPIKSANDAYSFMMHMRLSDQNKPHRQMARQAPTMPARHSEIEPGEPFGRPQRLKAGS